MRDVIVYKSPALAERLRETGRVRGASSIDEIGAARCVIASGDEELEALASLALPIVIDAAPPARFGAIATLAARAQSEILIAGAGLGNIALARMRGLLASEVHGTLQRLCLRAPGGRRVFPAASKRTSFDRGGPLSVREEDRAHIAATAIPFWRVFDAVLPGATGALAIDEISPDRGRERIVAHGVMNGAALLVEVDREVRGDEGWEIEAVCARATLSLRSRDGKSVLAIAAPLRKPEVLESDHDELALLALHAMSNDVSLARAVDAARVYAACEASLRDAAARAGARPIQILLVNIPRFRNRFDELRMPSLAIARLAAYVRGYGFETHIADLEAEHEGEDFAPFTDDARVDAWLSGGSDAEIDRAVDRLWPALEAHIEARTLIGFSIVDYYGHFQMNLASCLARRAKIRTGQPIVLGGERDQVDGDRALAPQMPFDYVVDGDGENALYELACLEAYKDRSARFIEGVWSRSGDAILKNAIVRSHLNAMPRPDFDGVPLDRYRRPPSAHLIARLEADGLAPRDVEPFAYLPYAFVKGCTADCTFCSAKEHLDVQAPEKSVGELLALSARHGVRDFVFLDNLVNLGPRWLERFCRLLIDSKADLQWTDSCRPTDIDIDLASLMRQAGCLLLNFGAESGSDAVLERMKKGLGREDILRTLRATDRAGIVNRVNLIAGYFHETEADVDLTISLVEELEREIDVIGCFQGFYLFPGMGVDPAAEGIVLRETQDRLKTGQLTLAYDEIGGLTWEAKREAIDNSRNRILRRIEELGIRTIDKIVEHDLFWISRRYSDKEITRRYLLREPPPSARPALAPGGQRGRIAI